jgi:hypothetical protein
VPEARDAFDADRALDAPGVDLGAEWVRHMRAGTWAGSWAVSDRVLRARAGQTCWHLPRHEQWVWDGRPLDGQRVLVRCYHGLGDTLQFVRFAEPLAAVAREVTVWVQAELVELVRTVPGVHRVLPLGDGAPPVDYDVDVEVMELPHVFRATPETLPRRIPYVHAEPGRRSRALHPACGTSASCGE